MKLALILFGISKLDRHIHWWNRRTYEINYKNSLENYKKFIYNYFEKLGYEINVYFTTNILSSHDKKEIIKDYKPIKYSFIENNENRHISRNSKFISACKLCKESKIKYDLYLITRFDLLFQIPFDKIEIDYQKINLVSQLEKPDLVCDNFYLLPHKYFDEFLNLLITKYKKKSYHFIYRHKILHDKIHFIKNEHKSIKHLSFYKINRNKSPT